MNHSLKEIFNKSTRTPNKINVSDLQTKLRQATIRSELESTDYIFIKCAEASQLGQECPYSQEFLEEVGAKRQALRDRLNS